MTLENETSPILQSLNPPQREAALHEKGPLLIIAGAGSGKTRAITHRMAHLIRRGYPPDSLLAITFTNKAAEEMKERMERLSGLRSPWVSTFHSFCARILRRHIDRIEPFDSTFTIYDSDDSKSLLKEVLDELQLTGGPWKPRSAQEEVSKIKNTSCGDVDAACSAASFDGQSLREIYTSYCKRLRERNALDFDDLLLIAVRLFEEHLDVLERYQTQFQQVLIDEYQDTNAVQYRIGKLLAARHRNICITGDPDQSIYGWRGADIDNILRFEQDYPDAKVVMLEQNYRSTRPILDVANTLIAHNGLRKAKSLWTEKDGGEPVRVYRFIDERQEANEVAELITSLIDEGVPLGNIAIFYRINALSRPVEQSLIHAAIPYSIVGGLAYFLRKEVKDMLAYLRIVDNPRDAESLKRILNVPTRGIGKASVEKLLAEAGSRSCSPLEVILDEEHGGPFGKKTRAAFDQVASLHRELAARRGQPVAETLTQVIRSTRYEEYLREVEGEAARERIENVWQLVTAAAEYDRDQPEGSLTGFLEMVNLLGDVDRWSRSEDRVSLMTLHSAKGLEFPVVVLVGVEDGILPLLSPEDTDPDFEEERRLLYVGITRAKERLYLTHTASRMRFGRVRAAYPSRFLKELKPAGGSTGSQDDSLEIDRETEDCFAFEDAREGFDLDDARPPSIEWQDVDPGIDAGEEDSFPVGTRVFHESYGEGDVVRVTGVGQRRRVTVAFGDAGEKQFVVGFAPLKRLR